MHASVPAAAPPPAPFNHHRVRRPPQLPRFIGLPAHRPRNFLQLRPPSNHNPLASLSLPRPTLRVKMPLEPLRPPPLRLKHMLLPPLPPSLRLLLPLHIRLLHPHASLLWLIIPHIRDDADLLLACHFDRGFGGDLGAEFGEQGGFGVEVVRGAGVGQGEGGDRGAGVVGVEYGEVREDAVVEVEVGEVGGFELGGGGGGHG